MKKSFSHKRINGIYLKKKNKHREKKKINNRLDKPNSFQVRFNKAKKTFDIEKKVQKAFFLFIYFCKETLNMS